MFLVITCKITLGAVFCTVCFLLRQHLHLLHDSKGAPSARGHSARDVMVHKLHAKVSSIAAASVSFLGHVNLNPAANNFIPKKELAQGQ